MLNVGGGGLHCVGDRSRVLHKLLSKARSGVIEVSRKAFVKVEEDGLFCQVGELATCCTCGRGDGTWSW